MFQGVLKLSSAGQGTGVSGKEAITIKGPASPLGGSSSPEKSFEGYLNKVIRQWKGSERALEAAEKAMPADLSAYLTLQRSMNKSGVEIQLVSSLAESVNQSMKRLQQAAGS